MDLWLTVYKSLKIGPSQCTCSTSPGEILAIFFGQRQIVLKLCDCFANHGVPRVPHDNPRQTMLQSLDPNPLVRILSHLSSLNAWTHHGCSCCQAFQEQHLRKTNREMNPNIQEQLDGIHIIGAHKPRKVSHEQAIMETNANDPLNYNIEPTMITVKIAFQEVTQIDKSILLNLVFHQCKVGKWVLPPFLSLILSKILLKLRGFQTQSAWRFVWAVQPHWKPPENNRLEQTQNCLWVPFRSLFSLFPTEMRFWKPYSIQKSQTSTICCLL